MFALLFTFEIRLVGIESLTIELLSTNLDNMTKNDKKSNEIY